MSKSPKELGIAPMAWETFKRWTIAEEHFEKGNKNGLYGKIKLKIKKLISSRM